MKTIFVFGSNLAGHHGGGSARAAVEHYGAIMGQGTGLQGDSYAIPTLDAHLGKLPLDTIAAHVNHFLDFAHKHPDYRFDIVAIGCGIAGFTPMEIAPMFEGATQNCLIPDQFQLFLKKDAA